MIPWWKIAAVLNIINTLLIIRLLYVYVKNFRKIKLNFTLGLMLFAIMFLLHNIVAFYYNFNLLPFYVAEVKIFAFIFTALQTMAFIALNWATWK